MWILGAKQLLELNLQLVAILTLQKKTTHKILDCQSNLKWWETTSIHRLFITPHRSDVLDCCYFLERNSLNSTISFLNYHRTNFPTSATYKNFLAMVCLLNLQCFDAHKNRRMETHLVSFFNFLNTVFTVFSSLQPSEALRRKHKQPKLTRVLVVSIATVALTCS